MRLGVVGALLLLAFAAAESTQANHSTFPGPQIYSIRVDGKDRRNLSEGRGWDDRLVRSRDGRRLAFVRWQPGATPGEGQEAIWTMRADGSGERELLREHTPRCRYCLGKPAWSPDGKRLAVVRAGAQAGLWLVDTETAGAQRLADATLDLSATPPSWSPDGSALAFHYADASTCGPGDYKNCATWSVRVVGADGRGLRVVATKAVEPRWSPAARWIAYRITDGGESLGLGVVRPDGRSNRRVYPPRLRIDGVGAFRWTPDGRRLVFASVSRTVLAARPERRGVRRTRLIGSPVEGFFEWSPNRRRIAAIWSPNSSTSTQVWVQNAGGQKRRRVTDEHHETEIPGGPYLRDVAWSRDGKRLFYVY
jgi:Tol biopolymer transport system component